MRMGVDYYPEHWERSMWETDADLMQETGISVVRLAEFSWSRLEPEEGLYNFEWLDEAVEIFAQRGIDVVLCTPTNCAPLWLYEKYPETVQVGRDGKRIATGVRGHRCYNSPVFRKKVKAVITKMAEHYAKNQSVIAWQIDNELEANFCCCEYCAEAFRSWMKNRYKTLEAVNRAHGNNVWSGEYSSWSQIKPPFGDYELAWYNPGYMLDFHRYASDSTVDYLRFQADILREYVPQLPITTNGWLCENMPDFYDLFHDLDFVSYDNYPTTRYSGNEEDYYSHAFHLDLMRGIKKKNFWIMEQLSGMLGSWMPMSDTPRPGMIEGYSLQAFAHGADTVLHFRWRSAVSGAEMHWHGIIDHSNVPGRRYEEFARLCKRSRALQTVAGARITAKVALLYSAEIEYAFKIQPQHQGFHYLNQLKAYHDAFVAMGINVDIIDWRSDISSYEVVVAPTLYLVDDEVTKSLYEFTEQGGTTVLTNRSGVKNKDNACIMQPLPTVFTELTGVCVKEYDAPGYREQKMRMMDGTEYSISGWCDLLEVDTAQVLAVYADEFYAGTAAVTCNDYGEGKAYYVGTVGRKDFYHALAQRILEEKGIDYVKNLPWGVEFTYREKEGKTYVFIFNNTPDAKEIVLPYTLSDFETGKEHQKGDVILLKAAQMKVGCMQS